METVNQRIKKRGWITVSELREHLRGKKSKDRVYMHVNGSRGFMHVEIERVQQMAYGVRLKGTLPANFDFAPPDFELTGHKENS